MEKINFTEGLPCFLGHEHIGSLSSAGTDGPLFNCDTICGVLPGRTGWRELIFSPYLYGRLLQVGVKPESPDEAVLAGLHRLCGSGLVRALDVAFRELYGCTPFEPAAADERIAERYAHYYDWYTRILQKLNCEKLVRTVHPHYLVQAGGGAAAERQYNIPLIRVDTMLGYPENGRLNFAYFERLCGFSIDSRPAADAAVRFFFELIDRHEVVGLKHFQAYYRTLTVTDPSAAQADAAFACLGDPACALTAQDYLLRRCFEEADKRSLVFQIHTGMTTLTNSDPALLEELFSRYPHVKFVLLHCFPFVEKAAYLAAFHTNVYVDTSWLVLQGENTLHNALNIYLGMVPHDRILLSTDSTNLEEMYGAVCLTRRILNDVLNEMLAAGRCCESEARDCARALLYENNKALYERTSGSPA